MYAYATSNRHYHYFPPSEPIALQDHQIQSWRGSVHCYPSPSHVNPDGNLLFHRHGHLQVIARDIAIKTTQKAVVYHADADAPGGGISVGRESCAPLATDRSDGPQPDHANGSRERPGSRVLHRRHVAV